MKISVVIAFYTKDDSNFFKLAIDSLLNQTLMPNQIVVVVDGPVDKEKREYLNFLGLNVIIDIVWLKKNEGLANALNNGVLNSKYDIIARMDADDICFPNRFQIQLNEIIQTGGDVVGGQIVGFGKDKDDILLERKLPLDSVSIKKMIKSRNPIAHPTAIFKREVFDTLGGYDINIFQEDYDFFVRASMKDFKMSNVKDDVLWFRMGVNDDAIRRRWGWKIVIREFFLYRKFYKIGFYTKIELYGTILKKSPLRLLPFPFFKYLYMYLNKR